MLRGVFEKGGQTASLNWGKGIHNNEGEKEGVLLERKMLTKGGKKTERYRLWQVGTCPPRAREWSLKVRPGKTCREAWLTPRHAV